MDGPKDDAARPPAGSGNTAPRGGRRSAKTLLENGYRIWGRSTEREFPPWIARDGRGGAGEVPAGARAVESAAMRALRTTTQQTQQAGPAPAPADPAAPGAAQAEPPPPGSAQDTPRRHDPQTRLFRAAALAAHARGARAASVVRITSVTRWMTLTALLLALAMAIGMTALGSVEETSAARGILRADFGVQAVVSGIGGTVQEVFVRSGDRVQAGGLVARLDAAPLEAELRTAEARLASIEQEWATSRRALVATHNRTATALAARTKLLTQTTRLQQARVARREQQAEKLRRSELDDVLEDAVRDQRDREAEVAHDALFRMREEREQLRQQAASAYGTYTQGLASGEQRVREARAQREQARALLRQAELRAPSAGVVESLRGHSGLVLAAGDWIARIVRDEAPRTLVAFVPERDAAFLRTGALAAVELDQLPVGEFGHLDARVVRVAGELADRSELVSALGETAAEGPHVRVELALVDAAPGDAARTADVRARLRPGTLVTARIPLRERRLLAIVFEPARRWLD